MKNRFNPFIALAFAIASSTSLQAALFWNANTGSPDYSGTWDDLTTNWNTATGGAGTPATWVSAGDAEFDVAAAYTVTADTAQTATTINIKGGNVTLAGTNTVSSTNLNISSGASFTAAGDRFLKIGTTTLTVDGTLNHTAAVSVSTRRVVMAGGSGNILLSGGFRTAGSFTFAGNISGTGSVITDAAGAFNLSGDNSYSGDTLIRNGNTIRVGSATALSPNSFLRLGGGTNIFELAAANFSRTVGGSPNPVRFHNAADGAGNTGFVAVNEDRTVALNGTVSWGAGLFNPTTFILGSAASTHKVTLTTPIDLNAGNRAISSTNGSAAIEGEISSVISGGTGSILTKSGTGVILLSNANTHVGGTVIAGSQGSINPLRISNSGALGTGPLTLGSGGNNDRAVLELTGGVTVTNSIPAITSRNNNLPNILNVSGTNTVSANISVGGGGSQTTLESAGDTLVMGGTISARQLNLQGAGNGEVTGNITIGTGYSLVKAGDGQWTIGNVTNGNTTTISGGILQVGKGGSTGSLGTASITNNASLVIDRIGSLSVPGSISGAGTITKRGTSAVTLSGTTIEYTGATSIEDGSLLVTGNASTATGAVTVGDGIGDATTAILGGTGPVGGAVTLASDGTIAPGAGVGTLSLLGSVAGAGSVAIEVDGATADKLVVGGALNITELKLDVTSLSSPTLPAYVIVDASSAITGAAFASVTGVPSGYSVVYNYNDGSDSFNIALVNPNSDLYTTWATTTYGLQGDDAQVSSDPDGDGIKNVVEYALGLDPKVSSQPPGTFSNGVLSFTKGAVAKGDAKITYQIESSGDLSNWSVSGNAVNGANSISLTLPAGQTREFARLKIIKQP